MQLWLSGSCALLCRVRFRLWLWPVYCPPDFIAHFRVLVVAGMWIWLWRIRSVLLIQAKKKTRPEGRVFPFYLLYLTLPFRVDQRHDHLDQHLFNLSCFQWHFPLFIYIQTMTMLAMHREIRLAGILLLPIATLLSFYVKQVQHINLHLSLIFL
jgi:hypothetical protein